MGAVQTARARARAELTREIRDEARRQLGEVGPAGLSLRAVARELGMVSSAIYRYFPSRDDLLTALIIEAYDAVGVAAEEADAACAPEDLAGRWRATARGIRGWALAHPHEYALVYGSPVPGYRAPEDTIGPASRVTGVLVGLLRDAATAGVGAPGGDGPAPELAVIAGAAEYMDGVPPELVMRGMVAWTQLFGLISFELFGHLVGSVSDEAVFFDAATARMVASLGLVPTTTG